MTCRLRLRERRSAAVQWARDAGEEEPFARLLSPPQCVCFVERCEARERRVYGNYLDTSFGTNPRVACLGSIQFVSLGSYHLFPVYLSSH